MRKEDIAVSVARKALNTPPTSLNSTKLTKCLALINFQNFIVLTMRSLKKSTIFTKIWAKMSMIGC